MKHLNGVIEKIRQVMDGLMVGQRRMMKDKGSHPDMLKQMLESTRLRPKTLFRDTQVLEREVEQEHEEIHELPNGDKVVTHVYVDIVKRRTITVREFDPEKSYGDAIQEFMQDE